MGNSMVLQTSGLSPIILPANMFTAPASHWQANGRCRDFEFEAAECIGAYGFTIGKTKCKDLLDDLMECANGEKQRNRREIIMSEFERKVKAGERTYEEAPIIFLFD